MTFFLVLLNPKEMQGWIARLLPWPREQADRLFSTSGQVIFDYYKGCTILACVNAIPIWLVARVLGVEAAGSILVVLFVSSYIPYIGAWIGGACPDAPRGRQVSSGSTAAQNSSSVNDGPLSASTSNVSGTGSPPGWESPRVSNCSLALKTPLARSSRCPSES